MNDFGATNTACQLQTSPTDGRSVSARRHLKPGELLLCEVPTVVGPYWDAPVCCLSCYTESARMCKRCRIAPLCLRCTQHDAHECDFLAASQLPANFLLDHFATITPLRCLMLTLPSDDADAERPSPLWQLESHAAERRDTAIWRTHADMVVAPLRAHRLAGCMPQLDAAHFDAARLQHICGILDVNTFEVRTPDFEQIPVRGLYPAAAMMQHDCVGNTFVTVDAQSVMRTYASVAIAAGEPVCINYTSTLMGTADRREHLRVGKYFRCRCRRCEDPTELGTDFSSVRCAECANDGLCSFDGAAAVWTCGGCGRRASDATVQQVLVDARRMMEEVGGVAEDRQMGVECVDELVDVIGRQTRLLNPNHCLVVETKQKLAALLRNVVFDGETAPRLFGKQRRCGGGCGGGGDEQRLLALKVRLCEELMPVLRTLKPGISRLTAIALYEHFTALHRLAELKHSKNASTKAKFAETLVAAEHLAKECVAMLVYEPRCTPEGHLAQNAMKHLRSIREQIARQPKCRMLLETAAMSCS